MTKKAKGKNIFKSIFYFFGFAVLALIVYYIIIDEDLPKGMQGPQADTLAMRMMAAVNSDAWDTTYAVKWTFRSPHYHVWDRKRNFAKVSWDNKEVLINIDERVGLVTKGGENKTEEDLSSICEKGWKYWVNDSFWLNPVTKVFDQGTQRRLIKREEGNDALLITYTAGGDTPGDSYLWIVDENGLPIAWKLWVSIIPIGGIEFTWEDWITLATGAKIASKHDGPIEIPIKEIEGASSLEALTNGVDIFESLLRTDDLVRF